MYVSDKYFKLQYFRSMVKLEVMYHSLVGSNVSFSAYT